MKMNSPRYSDEENHLNMLRFSRDLRSGHDDVVLSDTWGARSPREIQRYRIGSRDSTRWRSMPECSHCLLSTSHCPQFSTGNAAAFDVKSCTAIQFI